MSDGADNDYPELTGAPSDEVPAILATGRGDADTLFVSMSHRHPEGRDAEYLRWHSLDHRPEQQRLASLRTSLRLVSTPACRAARAAGDASLAAVDHVMIYFFAGREGLDEFGELAVALGDAGRSPFILPPVQRGVYAVDARAAAPRIKTGADVLPWFPVRGAYLLVERGAAAPPPPTDVPGVAGAWSGLSLPTEYSSAGAGQRLTLLFLDADPVAAAAGLLPALERRWAEYPLTPLLAAPFHGVVPYAWERYLP